MLDPILDISIPSLSRPGILRELLMSEWELQVSSSSLCSFLLKRVILSQIHPGLNSIVPHSINISTNFLPHSGSTENLQSGWPKKMQFFFYYFLFCSCFLPQKTLKAFLFPGKFPLLCDNSNKRMKSKSPRF